MCSLSCKINQIAAQVPMSSESPLLMSEAENGPGPSHLEGLERTATTADLTQFQDKGPDPSTNLDLASVSGGPRVSSFITDTNKSMKGDNNQIEQQSSKAQPEASKAAMLPPPKPQPKNLDFDSSVSQTNETEDDDEPELQAAKRQSKEISESAMLPPPKRRYQNRSFDRFQCWYATEEFIQTYVPSKTGMAPKVNLEIGQCGSRGLENIPLRSRGNKPRSKDPSVSFHAQAAGKKRLSNPVDLLRGPQPFIGPGCALYPSTEADNHPPHRTSEQYENNPHFRYESSAGFLLPTMVASSRLNGAINRNPHQRSAPQNRKIQMFPEGSRSEKVVAVRRNQVNKELSKRFRPSTQRANTLRSQLAASASDLTPESVYGVRQFYPFLPL